MAMALQQARTTVRTLSGLDALAGLWLVVAPFLLGYAAITAALWNSVIFGVAIILLALSQEIGEGYRRAGPGWTNAVIGLWLILAPFVLGFSAAPVAMWNHIIVGLIVGALALGSAMSTPRREVEA